MLSVVIYLNDDWEEHWGGQLNFYDSKRDKLLTKVPIGAGNCVIWNYNNFAFHGYPEPMTCPEGKSRKGMNPRQEIVPHLSNGVAECGKHKQRKVGGLEASKSRPDPPKSRPGGSKIESGGLQDVIF